MLKYVHVNMYTQVYTHACTNIYNIKHSILTADTDIIAHNISIHNTHAITCAMIVCGYKRLTMPLVQSFRRFIWLSGHA